jgi:hypothetical protein
LLYRSVDVESLLIQLTIVWSVDYITYSKLILWSRPPPP